MSLRAEEELNLNPGLADLVLHFIVLQKSICGQPELNTALI